jgi:hypothetical protein
MNRRHSTALLHIEIAAATENPTTVALMLSVTRTASGQVITSVGWLSSAGSVAPRHAALIPKAA